MSVRITKTTDDRWHVGWWCIALQRRTHITTLRRYSTEEAKRRGLNVALRQTRELIALATLAVDGFALEVSDTAARATAPPEVCR
jgi:hypothetical protein